MFSRLKSVATRTSHDQLTCKLHVHIHKNFNGTKNMYLDKSKPCTKIESVEGLFEAFYM